ncbi:MAG: bis(5'-nucleosyl)-tetraphosphatase (symmetrical) YqeK [Halanaerobiales bacterium]|nr:bis(5'-nucleosyl)-tetraphosphatase (symmetrical) YqeK [Halanaerobiales bacterium]
MVYDDICVKLQQMLDSSRYQHTLGVVKVAIQLAEHYGVSTQQARLAALLHDSAKCLSKLNLLHRLESSDILVDDMEREVEALLHGPVGAVVAKEDFGIEDEAILRAIRYHTTGTPDMTLLDKIIFLADYIEPNRDCPGIEEVREVAFIDLDQAIIMATERTIIYEINRNNLIHLRTVETRNALIERVKNDGRKK